MRNKARLNLLATLLMIGLIPVLIASSILGAICILNSKQSLEDGVYNKLHASASGLMMYYQDDMVNTDNIEKSYEYIDSLLDQNVVLTLFVDDTRVLTSIKNSDGTRNEGTKASTEVYSIVKQGKEYHAHSVMIGDSEYYVYYLPIKDNSGNVIGMAFAGESEEIVKSEIQSAIAKIAITLIVSIIVFSVLIIIVTIAISKSIKSILDITNEMATGKILTLEDNSWSHIKEFIRLIESNHNLRTKLVDVVTNINVNTSNLNNYIEEIGKDIDVSNQASEGISTAMEELARGSMEMAESVQRTASTMSDVGESIEKLTSIADDAKNCSEEIKIVGNEAESQLQELIKVNGETVAISSEVVNGIMESSESINNINKAADVITQIASQTSLLALNASIEAARAGEAGRGFSVVASEISKLASQSNESASEIQKIVSDIVKTSKHNEELAGKIKDAIDAEGTALDLVTHKFNAINENIDSTVKSIETIHEMAVQLDSGKMVVIDEMSNISSITEENAASCQETTASMQELRANIENINEQAKLSNEVAESLSEVVKYFK